MASQVGCRIAVIVRAHALSDKLTGLLEALEGHDTFDTYLSTNETNGVLDVGRHAKRPYTLQTMHELGFEPQDENFIVNCSDLLFEHYRRVIPCYDFYLLIEYDVGLSRGGGAFLDDLARKLRSAEYRDLDMTGTFVWKRGPEWSHYENAAKLFPSVHSVFFPLVVLSNRAIAHLYRVRLAEGPRGMRTEDRVFCEPFVASALMLNSEFRVLDLDKIFPGSYVRRTFYWGIPMLFGGPAPRGSAPEILHPVYGPRDFLQVQLNYATWTRTLPQYIAEIEHEGTRLDLQIRTEFATRARTTLLEQRQWDRAKASHGARSAEPSPACPPVVLLVDDVDLPVRDAIGDHPRALAKVGSRPLLQHVMEFYAAAGCKEFVVCSGRMTEPGKALLGQVESILGALLGPVEPRSREPRPDAPGWAASRGAAPLIHVIELPEVRTGARVKKAAEYLGDGQFILAYGHAISDMDLSGALRFHEEQRKPVTVVAARPAGVSLALDGDVPAVLDPHPRPGLYWGNAGCMVFAAGGRSVIGDHDGIADGGILGRLDQAGELATFEHMGLWQSADSWRELELLRRLEAAQELPRLLPCYSPSERPAGKENRDCLTLV